MRPIVQTRINLLPWREWERARRGGTAVVALLGALLAGLIVMAAAGLWLERRIDAQEQRNQLLEQQIAALGNRIDAARGAREQFDRSASHIALIRELRRIAAGSAGVLDALADTLVEGIHYRRIERRGATLDVSGVAASSRHIARLMRNLESSAWFVSANLKHLREESPSIANGPSASVFEMTFPQVPPTELDANMMRDPPVADQTAGGAQAGASHTFQAGATTAGGAGGAW